MFTQYAHEYIRLADQTLQECWHPLTTSLLLAVNINFSK